MRALALGGAAFLVFAPQLLAYRAINGGLGPSRLVTRKMTYSSPHFLSVLFDPAHGLFVWSPLLLMAAGGLLYLLFRRRDGLAACFALALLLQVWINGSVESWTQAGAFGSRRFVGATVLFAWGLAALMATLLPRGRDENPISRRRALISPWQDENPISRRRAGLVAGALFLCAWWNVSLMVQFGLRLMDRQGLDWPRVAVNQVSEVPRRALRVAYLFFADRERLVREGA